MPINVNLSPDRGVAAQTLMNRSGGAILRDIANFAFPGRINPNTEFYGHEDKQQLQINGGQRLDVIFDYLLENGEVKNPENGNNKEMKIYIKLEDPGDPIDLISSSSSDSDLEIDEGMKKKRKRRSTKRRKTTKRRKSTKRKTKRRKNKRNRRK